MGRTVVEPSSLVLVCKVLPVTPSTDSVVSAETVAGSGVMTARAVVVDGGAVVVLGMPVSVEIPVVEASVVEIPVVEMPVVEIVSVETSAVDTPVSVEISVVEMPVIEIPVSEEMLVSVEMPVSVVEIGAVVVVSVGMRGMVVVVSLGTTTGTVLDTVSLPSRLATATSGCGPGKPIAPARAGSRTAT